MHTDQENNFGSEDKIPLVDRRNFLRGVAATAAVATVGGPAALVTPALAAEGRRKDKDRERTRTGSRPTKSASSCSRSVTSSPSTSRARSPRSMRSATRGSSTRVLSGGPPRSSRRCWTPMASCQRPATSSSRSRSTRPLGVPRSPTRTCWGRPTSCIRSSGSTSRPVR